MKWFWRVCSPSAGIGLNAAHAKQLLTYLRLTEQPVGLLINFGGATLKEGLKRVVNGYVPSASSRLRVNEKQANSVGHSASSAPLRDISK